MLRKTKSYGWYSHGAQSLQEYKDICKQKEKRAADGINRDLKRQEEDKHRISEQATSNLYNAVRRGDINAVRALLTKGADASVPSPDGTSLVAFALSQQREDIADELNRSLCS